MKSVIKGLKGFGSNVFYGSVTEILYSEALGQSTPRTAGRPNFGGVLGAALVSYINTYAGQRVHYDLRKFVQEIYAAKIHAAEISRQNKMLGALILALMDDNAKNRSLAQGLISQDNDNSDEDGPLLKLLNEAIAQRERRILLRQMLYGALEAQKFNAHEIQTGTRHFSAQMSKALEVPQNIWMGSGRTSRD